jgi:spore coat polysaccharide biosynthesis protein SpsF
MDAAVRVVVQARMGSTRLPGKILAQLAGATVLEHVVRRLQAAERFWHAPWEVMVATTTRPEDDQTAMACRDLGVRCIRGETNDVLSRYLLAVDDLCDDAVALRATADNPLYCPERTAAIVREHFAAEADYTSIRELSYVVPEVFRVGALRDMARVAVDPYHREHVTPFFRQFPWAYRVQSLSPTWHGLQPQVPLTVDTEADYARMERLFQDCARPGTMVSLEDAYRWSVVHDGATVQRAAA